MGGKCSNERTQCYSVQAKLMICIRTHACHVDYTHTHTQCCTEIQYIHTYTNYMHTYEISGSLYTLLSLLNTCT